MKRLLISLVAATMLFGAAGFTAANRLADTPQPVARVRRAVPVVNMRNAGCSTSTALDSAGSWLCQLSQDPGYVEITSKGARPTR
jgi:hypothetical protein